MPTNPNGQFKVYLPVTNDISSDNTTNTQPTLHDGQVFQEVYVDPEFYLDYTITNIDGKEHRQVVVREKPMINIDLKKYISDRFVNGTNMNSSKEHFTDTDRFTDIINFMQAFCRDINLNPSYCELFYCEVNKKEYVPDNGLKLWKIQRHIYRYIYRSLYNAKDTDTVSSTSTNTSTSTDTLVEESKINKDEKDKFVDFLAKTSTYEKEELSPGWDEELYHYMKDLDISFASLNARGRLQEILAHIACHNINFRLSLRDACGRVFMIYNE